MSFCQTFTSVASPFAPFVLNMHSVDEIVISPSFNSHNFSTISFITFQRLDWIGIRLVYLLPNKNIFFAKIGKSSSSANPTTTGVPQASILGTLPFLIYLLTHWVK